MANTGFKGVNVKQTGSEIVFPAFLQNSAGALITTGATVTLKIYEVQSDGSYKTYDFSTNTFTAGAVTTLTEPMAYQKASNGTVDTGAWTYSLGTLTGFTVGAMYIQHVYCSTAFPTDQQRIFQYGGAEGDLSVAAITTGLAYLLSTLPATGADLVLTEGSINLPQAVALCLDVLMSIRSGVPAPGVAGTLTVKDPTGTFARAVIALDTSGDITGTTLTPPSV